MKIAFIVTDLSNARIGGISRVATEVGAGLVQSGHEVIAYVLGRKSHERVKEYKGMKIRYIEPFFSLNPDYPVMGFSWRAFLKFQEDASKERFDILQSFNLNGLAFPYFQKNLKIRRIPFVMASFETIYMDVRAKLKELSGLPSPKTLLQIVFETYLMCVHEKSYLRAADMVITEDENTRNALLRMGISTDRIRLAPSGVDVEGARTTTAADLGLDPNTVGPVIGYIGRVDPRKGVQFLMEALVHVKKQYPNVLLFLAGGSRHGYDLEIHGMAGRLRLEKNMRILGRIEGDILPYYKSADVVVIPSLSEGIPITLGEAMASRTPVVITRLPGVVPFVKPADLVHWARIADAGDLGRAIVEALKDPEKADRTERAYRFIQQYTWDSVAGRYLEIYKETMARTSPA